MLARKYKEFQRRMTRHWQKMNEENGVNGGQEVNQRFALENLSVHSAEFAGLVDDNQRQQQAFERAQNVQKANAHKPVFTVYEDPAGHEVDFFESSADWQTLDSHQHQNKENEVAASKWNHQSLLRLPGHQSEGAEVSSQPERGRVGEPQPLQVFVDDEFTAPEAPKSEVGLTSRSCTLRQRIEGVATEEELLAKKPLKNFDSQNAKTASASDAPKQSKRSQSVKELKSERLGYDLEKLKTSAGEVLSFEEVRAQAFLARAKRRAPSAAAVPPQNRFLAAQSSNHQPVNSFLESSVAADTSIGYDAISRRLSFATTSKKPSPRRAVVSKTAAMAALDHAAQEDMTINTRVAMSEVNDMFCSPERQQEVKVWDIREEHHPVERKLHFSIFDDSVESVAPSVHEQSIREDTSVQVEKHSFSIFSDEVAAAPPTDSKAKSQQRKPLGSREDLLRSARRTNKDVLLQLRQGMPDKGDAAESKDRR